MHAGPSPLPDARQMLMGAFIALNAPADEVAKQEPSALLNARADAYLRCVCGPQLDLTRLTESEARFVLAWPLEAWQALQLHAQAAGDVGITSVSLSAHLSAGGPQLAAGLNCLADLGLVVVRAPAQGTKIDLGGLKPNAQGLCVSVTGQVDGPLNIEVPEGSSVAPSADARGRGLIQSVVRRKPADPNTPWPRPVALAPLTLIGGLTADLVCEVAALDWKGVAVPLAQTNSSHLRAIEEDLKAPGSDLQYAKTQPIRDRWLGPLRLRLAGETSAKPSIQLRNDLECLLWKVQAGLLPFSEALKNAVEARSRAVSVHRAMEIDAIIARLYLACREPGSAEIAADIALAAMRSSTVDWPGEVLLEAHLLGKESREEPRSDIRPHRRDWRRTALSAHARGFRATAVSAINQIDDWPCIPLADEFRLAECWFYLGRSDFGFAALEQGLRLGSAPTLEDAGALISLYSSPFVPEKVRQCSRWKCAFIAAGLLDKHRRPEQKLLMSAMA